MSQRLDNSENVSRVYSLSKLFIDSSVLITVAVAYALTLMPMLP